MKQEMKKSKERGITLVALVVTIVVLLILAGITINLILGQDSIFNMAQKAGEEMNKAVENEQGAFGKMTNYLTEQGWVNSSGGNPPVLVESIILNKTSMAIQVGDKEILTTTIKPDDANNKNIIWSSSEPTVAAVSNTGEITGVSVGETIITATVEDNEEKSASCTVIVELNEPKEITYSWEELGEIAKKISNEEAINQEGKKITADDTLVTTSTKAKVKIGEEEKILSVGDWIKIDGRRVRILGFNHDKLTTPEAYGEATSTERAGISFEYWDCLIDNMIMYSTTESENGWVEKPLYKSLNTNDNAKYKDLKDNKKIPIKQVQKTYNKPLNKDDDRPEISNDYLWLLSCSEIWGSSADAGCVSGYSKTDEGKQYAFYANRNPKPQYNDSENDDVKHYNSSGTTSVLCWLRSPCCRFTNNNGFCFIHTKGYCSYTTAGYELGVAPGFSI